MFVGDDWKGSQLFIDLEEELINFGVEIFYFPYTKNISSTSLRATLQALVTEEKKEE